MHTESKKGQLQPKDSRTLQQIVQQDYGVALSDDEANQLGFSLLKVTRLAMGAFNRAEETHSMVSG